MAKHGAARRAETPRGDRGDRGDRGERSRAGGAGGADERRAEGLTSVPGAGQDVTGGAGGAVDLDRLIHERVRLGIVSALAVHDALSFTDLRAALQITDGNLSVHARKLEDAGYIACSKSFEGRVPRTEYRLTPAGRDALTRYVDHMEALIQALRKD